jgi:hypothetical protein
VLPAESVTALAVAREAFHTPTSTTIRSPVVTADPGVTPSDPARPRADTCCTNDTEAAAAPGTMGARLTAASVPAVSVATSNSREGRDTPSTHPPMGRWAVILARIT